MSADFWQRLSHRFGHSVSKLLSQHNYRGVYTIIELATMSCILLAKMYKPAIIEKNLSIATQNSEDLGLSEPIAK